MLSEADVDGDICVVAGWDSVTMLTLANIISPSRWHTLHSLTKTVISKGITGIIIILLRTQDKEIVS